MHVYTAGSDLDKSNAIINRSTAPTSAENQSADATIFVGLSVFVGILSWACFVLSIALHSWTLMRRWHHQPWRLLVLHCLSPLISRRSVWRLLMSSLFTCARQTFLGRDDLFGHILTKLQHTWMDIVEMINWEPVPAVFTHIFHWMLWIMLVRMASNNPAEVQSSPCD